MIGRLSERTNGRTDGCLYAEMNGREHACMHGWMKLLKKDGKMNSKLKEEERTTGMNERTNERRK